MPAYYNENRDYPARWLRNLASAGHIAPGVVDARSIKDIKPEDLDGYEQAHFFAGIGAWSYALRLAGVPDNANIWTGSCPCQPFSSAGRGKGAEDDRHLWPVWRDLIRKCRPSIVFGEQVASKHGRSWLGSVRSEMVGMGYAFGASDLPAAGVGLPHKRQRLYWGAVRLPHTPGDGLEDIRIQLRERAPYMLEVARYRSDVTWHTFNDGAFRPTEPGTLPVAYGTPEGVEQLRAYGNAIAPHLAAVFVRSFLECL